MLFFNIYFFLAPTFREEAKNRLLIRLLVAAVAFLSVVMFVDSQLRPTLKACAQTAVKEKLTFILNEAVAEGLEEYNCSYSDLVNISYLDNGCVSAIYYDTKNVNRLKSTVSSRVTAKLENDNKMEIKIFFGNIMDSEILNDCGFYISISGIIYGFSVVDMKSELESGGINQTKHRISLTVSASCNAYVGSIGVKETVSTDVLVAETVIVGSVPQGFYKDS